MNDNDTMPQTAKQSMQTRAIHGGRADKVEGAVTLPIFQSSTFAHSGDGHYDAVRYTRLSNGPNHDQLHTLLRALCGGEAALVTGSGMSAIATTLLALLGQSDHLLVQRGVYGGTHALVHDDLPRWGIDASTIDGRYPETWDAAVTDKTRLVYVETLTNPLVEQVDLQAVVAFAKRHGLVSVIDATFTSPINVRPIALGFDLVVHSVTKYMAGHSDVIAGCVVGAAHHIRRIGHQLNHLGGSIDAHACFLVERGLKTLPLRMRQHNANATALAQLFTGHPEVERVHYPGFDGAPFVLDPRGAPLLSGFGGVLSIVLRGGAAQADRFIAATKLMTHAPSLGGTETLITRPATTSHAGVPEAERVAIGIVDGLIRIACGIEGSQDLVDDATQALAASMNEL
ncbi:MAG: cystathionine beta-lyase/cystathionine gamma-synthase [Myxococcota bacterium]|jgi:cystathionine beta-lyase/cystathionine gamma-synthase